NELAFAAVGQPPKFFNPTFNFGNLSTVGQSTGQIALGVSDVIAADQKGFVPSVQSFSLQVQQDVGWNTVFSAGYVGTLSRHQQELLNLNYSPYGELFTAAAQDPSRFADLDGDGTFRGNVPAGDANLAQVYKDAGVNFSGANALQAAFLKKYPGYNTIGLRTFGGSSNYHALQAVLGKRLRRPLHPGMAPPLSKGKGTAPPFSPLLTPSLPPPS